MSQHLSNLNQVDSAIRKMELEAEGYANTLRNNMQVELIKIPQRIRKMPVKQFLSGLWTTVYTSLIIFQNNHCQAQLKKN